MLSSGITLALFRLGWPSISGVEHRRLLIFSAKSLVKFSSSITCCSASFGSLDERMIVWLYTDDDGLLVCLNVTLLLSVLFLFLVWMGLFTDIPGALFPEPLTSVSFWQKG